MAQQTSPTLSSFESSSGRFPGLEVLLRLLLVPAALPGHTRPAFPAVLCTVLLTLLAWPGVREPGQWDMEAVSRSVLSGLLQR